MLTAKDIRIIYGMYLIWGLELESDIDEDTQGEDLRWFDENNAFTCSGSLLYRKLEYIRGLVR